MVLEQRQERLWERLWERLLLVMQVLVLQVPQVVLDPVLRPVPVRLVGDLAFLRCRVPIILSVRLLGCNHLVQLL